MTENSELSQNGPELTIQEMETFSELNDILNAATTNYEERSRRFFEKAPELDSLLRAKGLNPQDYILRHRLVGSSLTYLKKGDTFDFDTPDHDIEKFVRENFTKEDMV